MENSQLSKRPSFSVEYSQSLEQWRRKYHTIHNCINSKAAIISLLWSFCINFIYKLFYQPANYATSPLVIGSAYSLLVLYGGNAFAFCFFPLAGYLADIKYGRHKTVVKSLVVLLISIGLCLLTSPIVALMSYSLINYGISVEDIGTDGSPYFIISMTISSIFAFVFFALFTVCIIMFNANIIQFGIDQLNDSPAQHQSLFIFWYFWTYYVAVFICQLGWNLIYFGIYFSTEQFGMGVGVGVGVLVCSAFIVVLLASVSLIVSRCGRRWFLIDSGRLNPYKLVRGVTKFARIHKVPIYRSAFTYCEDEIPSGLNLGKSKYGGPFTTEEVENVKAFYGILKIIFACGFAFFPNIASDALLLVYAQHISPKIQFGNPITLMETLKSLFLKNGLLSPLLAVIGIPTYIFVIRHFTYQHHSRLLYRIGLGILMMLASVIYTAILDTLIHATNGNIECMFLVLYFKQENTEYYNLFYLFPPRFMSIFSNVLIFTGLYEFICAQSPHSMKGLLIGLSFAIRGLFEVLAILMIFPFSAYPISNPSCGMLYYYVTITVGVVALAFFVYVAKKYKLRERDEPCHVRRYVEDYYSRIQEESGYD